MRLSASIVLACSLLAAAPAAASSAPEDVVAEVRRHTARYLDIGRAREDGYVQISGMEARHGYHFLNARSPLLSGAAGMAGVVDLARPPLLLYVERDGVWQLVGVEYALPAKPAVSPLPGATWHEHEPSCHYRDFREVPAPSARDCPATHPESREPFVLWHPALAVAHVWAWYPNPAGPFAEENAYLAPYGGATAQDHHARNPAEAIYSVMTHRVAGAVVLLLAGLVAWETAGARRFPWNAVSAPVWVGFGVYLFLSSDPESWPLGPKSFGEIFTDPLVLQHKALALLPVVFGIVGALRAAGLARGRARYVVPGLAAAGGVTLFLHFHEGRFHLDAIYLQHAAMGATALALGAVLFAAARVPRARRWLRWAWPAFLTAMAVVLLAYTES